MPIAIGDRLPDAVLKIKTDKGIEDVPVRQLCQGRRIVLFAVPGAFTPTCQERHLPAFLDKLDELRARGVDEVACVAVNDPFVLAAWARATGAEGRIRLLSDGNASFTRALGLEFDGSALGLGIRSKRWVMLVEDCVVKALGVEENPGEVTVSGPETVLKALG